MACIPPPPHVHACLLFFFHISAAPPLSSQSHGWTARMGAKVGGGGAQDSTQDTATFPASIHLNSLFSSGVNKCESSLFCSTAWDKHTRAHTHIIIRGEKFLLSVFLHAEIEVPPKASYSPKERWRGIDSNWGLKSMWPESRTLNIWMKKILILRWSSVTYCLFVQIN